MYRIPSIEDNRDDESILSPCAERYAYETGLDPSIT